MCCVGARRLASEHVGAGAARRGLGRQPEQPLPRRVEAHHQPVAVHLDDEVRRPVHDRLKLVAFPFERLAEPRARERHGKLMAGELRDPQPILVERPALRRPDDQDRRRRLVRQAERTTVRRRRSDRGHSIESVAVRCPEPQCAGGGAGQPDELGQHRRSQLGEAFA